ncbi:MAG: GSU3529 family protein [Desulfuromonadales bacterium]
MATAKARQQDDLPDYLAARIIAIADQMQNSRLLQDELDELIEQLGLYDTYGQTGYIGMGVNNLILEGTICRLEEKLKDNSLSAQE